MTVLRAEIERALDELSAYEEGMRFQGLAVVLAKQKWPDLVASERKWDRGLDAYAPASLASDAIGKGLASSLTATLDKIRADAEKIREHFGDVKVLIFATPISITSHTASKWAEIIKDSYGFDLVVMSREDIITELMLPRNSTICRSYLRIPVPIEADVEEFLAKAYQAAADVVASWLTRARLAGRPQLKLQAARLDEEGRETGIVHNLEDLHATLLESRRIVLEAPAGRGKTTTLIQLAQHQESQGLSFLIDLPVWVTFGGNVLEFIAGLRPFLSRGITAQDLARVCGVTHHRFLLNGWNEISDRYAERAERALADLERDFPAEGIIVATRTHQIRPPLPGSVRARLLPLSRGQRTEYLQGVLADRATALGDLLDYDRALDDLTRTPLVLAEVTSIFLAGESIPKTKIGVLNAVLRLVEQAEQHRADLVRPPLSGHGRDYLTRLAFQMISDGGVSILEAEARALVHSVSLALNAAGQIAATPEPAAILSALAAHHVLERLEYPSVAFRFEHQQFQEALAATELMRQLYDLIREEPERSQRYLENYVNQPAWEEPLRMVAEEIGAPGVIGVGVADSVAAGARLIEMTLGIDPVFAADLSRLCGPLVWREIHQRLAERVRAWYQVVKQHHRRCALAAMLASGSDDFIDILLPLLTSEDQQVRLRTYRAWSQFHPSTLGPDWRRIVGRWNAEQRSDFVGELVRERQMAEIGEEFARTDPSPRVRTVALQALQWVGATDAIARVLREADDAAFEQILRERVVVSLSADLRPRALATYRRLVETVDDPVVRVGIRLQAGEVGADDVSEGLKVDLDRWPTGRVDDVRESLLAAALQVVRRSDPQWGGWLSALSEALCGLTAG